ncbi:MAG TPA: hypothetical protein VHF89_16480, partial [Solirubrobacteraceae bacterium]|nr:hypothetical protein [Solirubrobacteraceae bacterium]
FNAAVAAVNRALAPGDIALVSKDIGFYVKPHAKVIEGHDTVYRGDELTARLMRDNERITVWAQDSFGPAVPPAMSIALVQCFGREERFDSASVRLRTRRIC